MFIPVLIFHNPESEKIVEENINDYPARTVSYFFLPLKHCCTVNYSESYS